MICRRSLGTVCSADSYVNLNSINAVSSVKAYCLDGETGNTRNVGLSQASAAGQPQAWENVQFTIIGIQLGNILYQNIMVVEKQKGLEI